MSGNGKRANIFENSTNDKKVSAKGLKSLLSALGRKLFNRVHRNEVEYGETLSKKRRKNCILKSVSSLSRPADDVSPLIQSPYRIKFRFTKEENRPLPGSVQSLRVFNSRTVCCDKCDCDYGKKCSFSELSVSSDSACDISSSQSSCDDSECIYRKAQARIKRKRSKSASDVSRKGPKTVENFIWVYSENMKRGIVNPTCDGVLDDSIGSTQHSYESLTGVTESQKEKNIDDSDYDILLTKSGYRIAEPFYENLKVIENLYESAKKRDEMPKLREPVQTHRTYDDVIESLKIWHMNSRNFGDLQTAENALNHCLEGYESLENDLNNDIEEFVF